MSGPEKEMTARDLEKLVNAKLVLEYLAEEQLTSAYDEFLATCPYLDMDLHGDLDRTLVTSPSESICTLKKIATEYRDLRIFIEKCKPLELRGQLIKQPNMSEIFKFLVETVVKLTLLTSVSLPPQNSPHPPRANAYDELSHQNCLNDCRNAGACLRQIPIRAQSSAATDNVDTSNIEKQIRDEAENTTVLLGSAAAERALERLKLLSASLLDSSLQNASTVLLEHNSSTSSAGSQDVNPDLMAAGSYEEFASGVAGWSAAAQPRSPAAETNTEWTISPEQDISIDVKSDSLKPDIDIATGSQEQTQEFRSVYNCNEETENYFVIEHDENEQPSERVCLKDGYAVMICCGEDDEQPIWLEAMPFVSLLDEEPSDHVKTEDGVSPIASIPIDGLNSTLNVERNDVLISEPIGVKVKNGNSKDSGSSKRKQKKRKPKKPGVQDKRNKLKALRVEDLKNFDVESVLSKLYP